VTKNITIAVDEALARETRIAAATAGKSVSRFIADMLKERVTPQAAGRDKRSREGIAEKLMEIGRRAASLPVLDPREPDDILYDEFGLPK
jgi:antitoxin VapB